MKGTGGPAPPGARHEGFGGKRVQIARSRLKQWSPRIEQRFLTTLSATCNVKAACAEVGLTPASAYAHRRRWQGFADRWKQALEDGYAQLEAGLVFAAGNFLSGEAEIGPITGVTMAHALELYEARERQQKAQARRHRGGGPWRREPDIAEITANFQRIAEVIKHHDPEQLARARKQWERRRQTSG